MPTAQQHSTKKSCHCFHCKKDGFTRRDLDQHFLCETCRAIPGVRGYGARLPATGYGSAADVAAYWSATKHQLHIVTDEEVNADVAVELPPTATITPPPKTQRRPRTAAQSRLKAWTRDVSAVRGLSGDAKNVARVIADHADFVTGDDAWPKLDTLAALTGMTVKQVKRLLRELVVAGWIEVEHRRVKGRHTSNQYWLRWSDGRTVAQPEHETGPRTVAQPEHETGLR